jgi:hypothetical protein
VPRGYKEDNWSNEVNSVRESVKKRVSWKGAAEVEESPLLETVTRELLVKTLRAGKALVGAVVIGELWRLAVAL